MSNIQKTTNYSQFKFFPENRDLVKLDLLKESIEKNNKLAFHPIHVSKDFYVVDGQHRLECAKELRIPIYYIVDENATCDDIPYLNSTSKVWNSSQFLEFYCKKGNPTYLFMKSLQEKYDLNCYFVSVLCCATNNKRPSEMIRIYKNGEAVLTDSEDVFEIICKNLFQIEKFCQNTLGLKKSHTSFRMALSKFLARPSYNHDRLMKKMNLFPDKMKVIIQMRSVDNISELLMKLYNHHQRLDIDPNED